MSTHVRRKACILGKLTHRGFKPWTAKWETVLEFNPITITLIHQIKPLPKLRGRLIVHAFNPVFDSQIGDISQEILYLVDLGILQVSVQKCRTKSYIGLAIISWGQISVSPSKLLDHTDWRPTNENQCFALFIFPCDTYFHMCVYIYIVILSNVN